MDKFVDFDSLEFGGHETTLRGVRCVEWMDESLLVRGGKLVAVSILVDLFCVSFSGFDALDDFQLLVGQNDIFLVQLVADRAPPIWVFGF